MRLADNVKKYSLMDFIEATVMFVKKHLLAFILILILFVLFSTGTVVSAKQQDSNETKDLFEMSLEELMEVPVVISASRQAQKVSELSAPVSIITAEDIHYSGLTSIPEILQFSPGVDVLKINRYTYAIGVRGLHQSFSDRVQLLVNGRIADNTVYGGPEFCTLPVLIEDIERIEIVRGPGGAAWGANAFTGVINIITKNPEDVLGYFSSTTINEFGDSYTHARWAGKKDKWSWRVSTGYEDFESSDEAGAGSYKSYSPALNGLMGFNSFTAQDFARNWRFDTEAIYRASKMTEVSFGVGYSHLETGSFEQMGYFPKKNRRNEQVRSFAKIDHKFENGSSGYLQWFGNFWNVNWPNLTNFKTSENDFEAQYNFTPAEDHQTSIGGNFRWTHINSHRSTDQQAFLASEPYNEYWAGLFVIDRWKVTDQLTLEAQIRGDWYSETQIDWSTRLSALYALDERKDHVLRFSFAKAFRSPLATLRKVSTHTMPLGGGMYVVNATAPDGLDNEETFSLEAGYTGKFTDGLTLRANTYYQRFSNLIGYRSRTAGAQIFYTADNIDGADSWGGELELALENKRGKLSAWYAYNDFEEDQGHQSIRSFLPAKHKAGLTGRLFLNDGWTLNANYKFTNTTHCNPAVGHDVSSSNRLDLTVSRSFAKGKGELMFGVSDLLTKTHESVREPTVLTSHEMPGRMFFARLQVKF